MAEEEQNSSLNSGRYVRVAIEEDGKTEEEFIDEILSLNDDLQGPNQKANALAQVIAHNVAQLTGETETV